jgi:hypothetical protein
VQDHVDDEDGRGEHPGDLHEQHGELAQPDLELGLGLVFGEAEGDPAELRLPSRGDHHPGAGTGSHNGAHQRAAAQLGERSPRGHGLGGFLRGHRFAGQDRLLALQSRGCQQPDVGRDHLAQLQVDDIAGDQPGHVG